MSTFGSGGGFGFNYSNPSGGMTNFGVPSPPPGMEQTQQPFNQFQDLLQNFSGQAASNQGTYNPGSGMYQYTVHSNPANPFSGITYQQAPQGVGGIGGLGQMEALILGDIDRANAAANYNYAQNLGAANQFLGVVNAGAEDIRAAGQAGQEKLTGVAQGISDLGKEMYETQDRLSQETVQAGEDYNALFSSAKNASIAKKYGDPQRQLDAQAKATGDPNIIQAAANNRQAMEQEAATEQSAIMQNYINTNVSTRSMRAQVMGQAAGNRAAMEQFSGSLHQAGAQMAMSAEVSAAQHAANGNFNYAQLIAASPYGPASYAEALATYFTFSQTPGAQSFGGFSDELLFS